jgi:type VI secretion system secreted protein VgrG
MANPSTVSIAQHRTAASALREADFSVRFASSAAAWTVVRACVTEALSELFECSLDLVTDGDATPEALVGQGASFTVTRGEDPYGLRGVVTAVIDRGLVAGRRLAEVTVRPAMHVLTQRSTFRIFQDMTALEVVAEVLKDAGVHQEPGALVVQVDRSRLARREYTTQYGETDLAFIARLLEDEGVTWRIDHERSVETLELTDATRPRAFAALRPRPWELMGDGGATATRETVRSLERSREVTVEKVTLRDHDFTHPLRPETATQSVGRGAVARERYEYPGGFVRGPYDPSSHRYGRSNAARVASVRLGAETAVASRVRGRSNITVLAPGRVIEVITEEDGAPERLVVTRVTHTCEAPEGLYEGADGARDLDRYANEFEGVPDERGYTPPRVTRRPHALAPQSAVVVGEPEGADPLHTDAFGRVRVRVQWDRAEASAGAKCELGRTCWVRVAQPWAGSGMGFVFTPRVGTEVLVQFLDGDPDRPVVAGCLYNGASMPPIEVDKRRSQSVLRTRSTDDKGGYSELLFEDLAGGELVSLRAQRDLKVHALGDREDATDGGERVTVGKDSTLHVKGRSEVRVDGARATRVKGDDALDVQKNLKVNAQGAMSLRASKECALVADDGLTLQAGGGSKAEIAPDEVTIDAPSGVTLKCGASEVSLTPTGVVLKSGGQKVELSPAGVTVSTAAGAKLELVGPNATLQGVAVVTIQGVLVKIN